MYKYRVAESFNHLETVNFDDKFKTILRPKPIPNIGNEGNISFFSNSEAFALENFKLSHN